MSRFEIETNVNDSYKEHDNFHQSFHADCSSCFTERKDKNLSHDELLKKHPALQNPYGSNYPVGYRPHDYE